MKAKAVTPQFWLSRAISALCVGKYHHALRSLCAGKCHSGPDPFYVFLLFFCEIQLGKTNQAIAYFTQLNRIQPDAPDVLFLLGNGLQAAGQPEKARSCFDRGAALTNAPDTYQKRRWQRWQTQRLHLFYKNAGHMAAFRIRSRHTSVRPAPVPPVRTAQAPGTGTRTQNPDSVTALCTRADILTKQGRYEEALICCELAIARCPRQPEAWNLKGRVLVKMQTPEAALPCFDRALRLQPDISACYSARAEAEEAMGHFAAARADLHQARLLQMFPR